MAEKGKEQETSMQELASMIGKFCDRGNGDEIFLPKLEAAPL
jgi:hypothetical protein